jgi:uncharacterized protein (DUF4415 family)
MRIKEFDFTKAKRGAIRKSPKSSTLTTLRIDNDILDWFRQRVHQQGGGDYEALMNDVLRQYIQNQDSTLESTIRRVIREELKSMTKQAA